MATVSIKAVTTWDAMRILENFRLEKIKEVVLEKKNDGGGGQVPVTFVFKDGFSVEFVDSFSVGYNGSGLNALNEVLTKAGFPEKVRNFPFEWHPAGVYTLTRIG